MNDQQAQPREQPGGEPVDFTSFDELVEMLARWSGSLPEWPPARAVRAEWEQIEPRLDRARRELSRMLVVGVIGGTGTGKSTLVNALAGCDLSPAGDIARPTTINPVVVAPRDVDLSWLPVEAMNARVVRSDAAAVANIVLVDCPDPDTQAEAPRHSGGQATHSSARPSDSNHNRELLEAVLPACDVLLLVSTAQKYRSWVVAREVAAFAPGRPLLFVQTHASRDPDIRDDWRRELESQGFVVPRIFRLDAVEAATRSAAGLEPDAGFRELVEAIDAELVGRAARRVRRTGSLDLAGWFLRQSQESLAPLRGPVAQLAAGVASERTRLEGILARAVGSRLRASRTAWQRILTGEIVERWHGGPFASFLHVVESIIAFWPRMRAAGGGLITRLLAGQPADMIPAGQGGWQAVEELGLSAAEVEQSRSVLCGLSARARLAEPLVGRARLDESRVAATVGTLLERTAAWLSSGIDRLVADRRGRIDGPVFRWVCEALFSGLLVAVLVRAGWNFFVGHLWQGRVVDGGGFLQEALVWVILWGFFLRWIAFARVRVGLNSDIQSLVSRLPQAHLTDPLLADFAAAADATALFIDHGDRLSRDHEGLVARLTEPGGDLGHLRGDSR
ncbi:MAG: GTPase domain-containing protein [Planctomycetia bacterium]|nr:GTPase domain-containing protein [Planctomycetia bacterium]